MSESPYDTPAAAAGDQPGTAQPYVPPPATGPLGRVRGTGLTILLFIITFGIYGLFWYYLVHEEMKRHKNGDGLGGVFAVIIAAIVGVVMPFITSNEVGELYERRGQEKPVSGLTGLWYFPGIFIIVGPIVWFVKTNGALNRYWESLGATSSR